MPDSVEFNSFYKLLSSIRDGDNEKAKELEWILAEYEHAKDARNAYDELGQIFCHHGVMELYEYTGIDSISYINTLNTSVWDYLSKRMNNTLSEYMTCSMLAHAKDHQLAKKISSKWDTPVDEIEKNLKDLAKYVTDGIVAIVS